MGSLSPIPSAMELDLKCWKILRSYATMDLLVGEVESQLSGVFKDSVFSYDEAQWAPRMGRIMGTEPDDIDGLQANLKWIDDAISELSLVLFTCPETLSCLKETSPVRNHSSQSSQSTQSALSSPASTSLSDSIVGNPIKVKISVKGYAARKHAASTNIGSPGTGLTAQPQPSQSPSSQSTSSSYANADENIDSAPSATRKSFKK